MQFTNGYSRLLADLRSIRKQAQNLIDSMTEESTHKNGAGYLTIGEALAIFMLHQYEWSRNEICKFVFGSKNTPRMESVGGVLNEMAQHTN